MARYDHLPIWKDAVALAVEELKLLIQMGKEVRAFASFQAFERAVELAIALHVALVLEHGYLKTGFKRRVFQSLWWPTPVAGNVLVGVPPSAMPSLAIPREPGIGLTFAPLTPGTDHVC